MNFSHEVTGHSHGQTDMRLTVSEKGEQLGYVDYLVYEKQPSIKFLFVKPEWRRRGIATLLMKEVQKLHPDQEINLGMSTQDGSGLVKSLNRSFTKNPEFRSLHTRLKQLKSRLAGLQKQYDDFYENPTEENRRKIMALGNEFNDINDEIYQLERDARDTKPGKWFIGFKEWLKTGSPCPLGQG